MLFCVLATCGNDIKTHCLEIKMVCFDLRSDQNIYVVGNGGSVTLTVVMIKKRLGTTGL